jgi:hypothetical protein
MWNGTSWTDMTPVIKGSDGHSPYIDTTTKTWWEWDDTALVFTDTGISPYGFAGADGHSPYTSAGTWWEWSVAQDKYIDTQIPVTGPIGPVGPTLELQNDGTNISWRVVGTSTWNLLTTVAAITGADGVSPMIGIGTVTTLAYNVPAWVQVDPSSTQSNVVFNFGIPKGQDGTGTADGNIEVGVAQIKTTDTGPINMPYFLGTGAQTPLGYATKIVDFGTMIKAYVALQSSVLDNSAVNGSISADRIRMMKVYKSFSEVLSTFTVDTDIDTVISGMENESILITAVPKNSVYPEAGLLTIVKRRTATENDIDVTISYRQQGATTSEQVVRTLKYNAFISSAGAISNGVWNEVAWKTDIYQANWTESTVTAPDYIKNKPYVSSAQATTGTSGVDPMSQKAVTDLFAKVETDKADKIVTPSIVWNPNSFNVPKGRQLKFNTAKTPYLTADATSIDTIAVFAQVTGHPSLLFGFFSNDDGSTTQAGLFHRESDGTFSPDILLYNGTTWLNGGLYTLRYGISGNFNSTIGTLVVLNGFDLSVDISVPDVPPKNVIDVENELDLKQNKLTEGAGIAIVETDPFSPVIKSVTAIPDVNAAPGVPADARGTGGLIAALTASSKFRGTVLNAYASQGSVYTIDTATIFASGSGYSIGDALILPLHPLDAIIVVSSVTGGGGVSGFTVSKGGNSDTDFAGSVTAYGGLGVGARFTVVTKSSASSILVDILNPVQNDSATVLRSELHNSTPYDYMFADFNGDGVSNWVPVGPTARNFSQSPITGSEIASGAVGGSNVASGGIVYDNLDAALKSKVDDIANKENKDNKTTTISSPDTASDTKYPSEKAVAASLAALAPKLLSDVEFWVSFSTGDDTNDGLTYATALQSFAEVMKRVSKTGINYTMGDIIVNFVGVTTENINVKDLSSMITLRGRNPTGGDALATIGSTLTFTNCSSVTFSYIKSAPKTASDTDFIFLITSSRIYINNCVFGEASFVSNTWSLWMIVRSSSEVEFKAGNTLARMGSPIVIQTGSKVYVTGAFSALDVQGFLFSPRSSSELIWSNEDALPTGFTLEKLSSLRSDARTYTPWFSYDYTSARNYVFKTKAAFDELYPLLPPGALYVNEWESGLRPDVNPWDYSFDEVRIGTFADGRGVYKRTFHPSDRTTTRDADSITINLLKGTYMADWVLLGMDGSFDTIPNNTVDLLLRSALGPGTLGRTSKTTSIVDNYLVASNNGGTSVVYGSIWLGEMGGVTIYRPNAAGSDWVMDLGISTSRVKGSQFTNIWATVYYVR